MPGKVPLAAKPLAGLENESLEKLISALGGDISLDTITHMQFKKGEDTELHNHRNLLHLTVVESGTGLCIAGKKHIRLVPGTILFVYPNEIHSFCADKKNPYCNFTVKIHIGGVLPRGLPRTLSGEKRFWRKLCKLLYRLLSAHSEKEDMVRLLVEKSILLEIFAELIRMSRGRRGIEMPSSVSSEFEKTLTMLQTPPFLFPGLDSLSGMNRMGRRSFTSHFRELVGVSPRRFQECACMGYARKLLERRIYSVKEVGVKCGYSNSQNFIRSYKKYYGCTPRKMQNKESPGGHPIPAASNGVLRTSSLASRRAGDSL